MDERYVGVRENILTACGNESTIRLDDVFSSLTCGNTKYSLHLYIDSIQLNNENNMSILTYKIFNSIHINPSSIFLFLFQRSTV